jgi:hypothetical protein
MVRGGSVYDCQHARFDHARPLTEDEMRRYAPSIFATTPHESRSDCFHAIPTIEVLQGLQKEGFSVVAVNQSTSRDASRRDFTKHMVRLRRLDDDAKYKVGDTVLEAILKNANDGTAAYELLTGMFRIACLNSLVTMTSEVDHVKVRHTGDVQHNVIEGTYRVIDEGTKFLAAPQDWPRIALDRDERLAYATAAHALRFDTEEGEQLTGAAEAIKPVALLAAHRQEDTAPRLWHTFNTVQESCINGRLHGRFRDANNRTRRATMRPVRGIDQDVKLNKALFILATKMAELKGHKFN